jgi:hypothetical protein
VSQSVVVITAQFAGVTSHSDNIAAFCKQVSRKAGVIATVNWGCRFPEVYVMVAEHLAFHTALISCAQAYALDLYVTGYENIPNPLDKAQHEVSTMHTLGLVTDFELIWHLTKFDQERNEIAREHCLLRECMAAHTEPQLGKCGMVLKLFAGASLQPVVRLIMRLRGMIVRRVSILCRVIMQVMMRALPVTITPEGPCVSGYDYAG